MLRVLTISAMLLMVLVGCSWPGQGGQPANLASLALQPGDLRDSVEAGPARYWSNAQAARRDGISVSAYDAHGRVRSYQNSYTPNFSVHQQVALQRAGSEITEYRDTQGAHWGWRQLTATWRRARAIGSTTLGSPAGQAAVSVQFKRIAVPRVGDETAGYAATWGGDEFDYTTTALLFRRGRFVAAVEVIGIMGMVRLATALDLARAVDRRLAQGTS